MNYALRVALVIVGIIHLLPVVGVLGPERLQALYGVSLADPNLILLMRHRAILFGLLGAYIVIAAFVPSLQLSALILGAVSLTSFLVLAATGGTLNPSIARIAMVDWIAVAAAAVGFIAYALQKPPA